MERGGFVVVRESLHRDGGGVCAATRVHEKGRELSSRGNENQAWVLTCKCDVEPKYSEESNLTE